MRPYKWKREPYKFELSDTITGPKLSYPQMPADYKKLLDDYWNQRFYSFIKELVRESEEENEAKVTCVRIKLNEVYNDEGGTDYYYRIRQFVFDNNTEKEFDFDDDFTYELEPIFEYFGQKHFSGKVYINDKDITLLPD